MTTPAHRKLEPPLLLTPGVIALTAAFLLPVAQVIAYAFFRDGSFSWSAIDLTPWKRLFEDDYHLFVGLRTLRLGLIVTALSLLLGYPLALIIESASQRLKTLLLLALILPLMTSVVVRTFGWLVILGRGGPIARFLRDQGLVANNFQLAYTETGVVLAMTQVLLPYMVLVLVGVLAQIDKRLIEAARTMGAGSRATLTNVVIPLSLPGILAGSVLVFAVTISSFITPVVIGGLKLPVLASGVYHSAISYNDWPLAAAQATALFVVVVVILLPYALSTRKEAR
ncbi:ABC transporter permease [Terrarubrum flagellatum]|uniref:ABC transporter permease n=1 Tax=Terrirubrum flagellatum TaxID=2895980 RepID=UPI00314560A3